MGKNKVQVLKTCKGDCFSALLRKVPIDCRDAVPPKPITMSHCVNSLTHEKIREKWTMKIYISLVLVVSFAWKWGSWRRSHKSVQFLAGKNRGKWSSKLSSFLYGRYSHRGRHVLSDHLPVRHRHRGWSNDWKAGQQKSLQRFQHFWPITLQQEHLLCLWYQSTLEKFFLPIVWYIFQRGIKSGASFNHLQWKI